jgi:hypothetical protein
MNNKRLLLTAAATTLLAGAVNAQQRTAPGDTVIKASTIEITQVYKPEVKQAPKPDYAPALPPADRHKTDFDYTVPAQPLYYPYKSLPLRPLALGKDSLKPPYDNYIKGGAGNLHTVYLDAGIGAIRGTNFETDIHFGHLSQEGKLNYQKQNTSTLNASGTYHQKHSDWIASVDALHYNFFQYGFDQDKYPTMEAARQQLSGGRVSVGRKAINPANDLYFDPTVKASYFTGNHINSENSFGFDLPVRKQVDSSLTLGLAALGVITNLSAPNYSVSNNIFRVSPFAFYRKDDLSVRAMLSAAWGQNGTAYFLPDIDVRYRMPELDLSAAAGIKGDLRQNTYEQLYLNNPYLSTFPSIQTHSNEFFARAEKGIGNHISLNARLAFTRYNYYATYVNDPANRQEMLTVYDPKVDIISVQAGFHYQIGNYLVLNAAAQFNNFAHTTFSKLYHVPGTRLNADLTIRPIPALSLTAYATVMDGIYAISTVTGSDIKLPTIFDMGVGAEYQLIPRLSLFLNINNLTNNVYQRWYGYDVYGINIYGGLRFKF